MKESLEIALISDTCGWHCQQLQAAFDAHQAKTSIVSLADCIISTEDQPNIRLPGFTKHKPDGAFVRGVPGGSLENVVFYLDILHGLERLGVHVYNNASMIERSVDKAMTSFLLKNAGINTPPTWVTVDYQKACEISARLIAEHQAVVLKPIFGSQGKDIQLISDISQLPEAESEQPRVYYLQQFVKSTQPHDWRVFVVGDQIVSAMQRYGKDWLHNAALGAECRYTAVSDEMAKLAIKAVRSVGLFYAGVDLMYDINNILQVIEINSIPSWKSLQEISSVNIAEYLVDYFMATRYCSAI
ncbi:MAG: RimK family alpha-L-glutamate ligase [Chromatiales bacterium]|nr:RimK family alpha-L-glutamate ligase [Chromatiales bacterium]